MNITWSGQARCDLHTIRDFIARDSELYARLQVERLITRVERAAAMPSREHPVHEFNLILAKQTAGQLQALADIEKIRRSSEN